MTNGSLDPKIWLEIEAREIHQGREREETSTFGKEQRRSEEVRERGSSAVISAGEDWSPQNRPSP
jgi:hypothetical protein